MCVMDEYCFESAERSLSWSGLDGRGGAHGQCGPWRCPEGRNQSSVSFLSAERVG